MLSKQNRIRKADQFGQVMREGSRAGNDLMVVHYLADQPEQSFPLVGFIVSKRAMPHAVDRNRIKRQLRAIIRDQIADLPAGSLTVVRVNKKAKGAPSDKLAQVFAKSLQRAKRKAEE